MSVISAFKPANKFFSYSKLLELIFPANNFTIPLSVPIKRLPFSSSAIAVTLFDGKPLDVVMLKLRLPFIIVIPSVVHIQIFPL
ncbi:MAG: hypothetical protein P8Q14_06275 [Vicingaceae bacterium]|nr:hypothetical protein [Vicingaceae bacterium]